MARARVHIREGIVDDNPELTEIIAKRIDDRLTAAMIG